MQASDLVHVNFYLIVYKRLHPYELLTATPTWGDRLPDEFLGPLFYLLI